MIHYFRITFPKLELPVSSVNIELGYGSTIPYNYVIELIQHIFDDLKDSIVISYVFSIFDGLASPNSIKNKNFFDTGAIIVSQLKQASQFAVFSPLKNMNLKTKYNRQKIKKICSKPT